jgi:hypothetical protein
MNFYNDNQNKELWIRDLENNIKTGYNSLSSIYIKYKNINLNFFNNLNANQITRFDVFYDSIFIENEYGYVFEKLKVENYNIYPYNQVNLFDSLRSTKIDYWFNEKLKKVYFCGFYDIPSEGNDKIKFSFFFKEFDINTGQINILLNKTIILYLLNTTSEWSNSNGIKYNPKLTYNFDTNIFNLSFLIKSEINRYGLISVNFNEFDIIELNAFVPFVELDLSTSTIT